LSTGRLEMPADSVLADPDDMLDWLIESLRCADMNYVGGALSKKDLNAIFSSHPDRRTEAFHRSTCERIVSRIHSEYEDWLRMKGDSPAPTQQVLFAYNGVDGLTIAVPLHRVLSILLMPANFGAIAKLLVLRDEAITIGFYRAGCALVSQPSDSVHSFLTDTDPKLLDPGRYEARSSVNHGSVMLNPGPAAEVKIGDSLYVIFPPQLCHKPPHALGRFVT
jgi:hypothetical protein